MEAHDTAPPPFHGDVFLRFALGFLGGVIATVVVVYTAIPLASREDNPWIVVPALLVAAAVVIAAGVLLCLEGRRAYGLGFFIGVPATLFALMFLLVLAIGS